MLQIIGLEISFIYKEFVFKSVKNLTLNLEEEISLLSKYRITPTELMAIRTLLILQDEKNEELFQKYIELLYHSGIKLKDLFLCLQNKEIILKSWKIKEGAFDPYEIPLNKSFVKNIYRASFELGKELFENYPQFGMIGSNVVPLRTVARHYDSLEEAYEKYGKAIKNNAEKHAEIIELVKWAKENSVLNCSLSSFIINRGWLDLQAIKDGDKVNINYDAVKLV